MSNRQMDEAREDRRSQYLADELGITIEQFDRWVESEHPDESSDGAVVGHVVNFHPDTPREILVKSGGDRTVNLGPLYFDED